jgi:hypothetical protein
MSQPHLSHNLDKIIQLISIEQLLGLAKQLKMDSNNNCNISSNHDDVLSTPIVKNMISSYENELQMLRSSTSNSTNSNSNNTKCCCESVNTNIIAEIQKIGSQLENIHNNIAIIVDKMNTLESRQNIMARKDEEHIKLTIEEKNIGNNSQMEQFDVASDAEEDAIIKSLDEALDDTISNEAEEEEAATDVNLEEEEEVNSEEAEEEEEVNLEEEEEVNLEEATDVNLEETEEEVNLEEAEEDNESLTEPEISDESDTEIKEEEEEEEDEEEVEVEETKIEEVNQEEAEEEEVFEIEIDDVTYFATDEENGILYEVDKDGDVGKKVGIIKNGEPIFS